MEDGTSSCMILDATHAVRLFAEAVGVSLVCFLIYERSRLQRTRTRTKNAETADAETVYEPAQHSIGDDSFCPEKSGKWRRQRSTEADEATAVEDVDNLAEVAEQQEKKEELFELSPAAAAVVEEEEEKEEGDETESDFEETAADSCSIEDNQVEGVMDQNDDDDELLDYFGSRVASEVICEALDEITESASLPATAADNRHESFVMSRKCSLGGEGEESVVFGDGQFANVECGEDDSALGARVSAFRAEHYETTIRALEDQVNNIV
jgi:hypothetical protein